jgi:hypothetical protein
VDTALLAWQRRAVAASVAGGGGFTIASDDLLTYGAQEWALLAAVRAAGASADGPLDLVDPFAAVLTVRSGATVLEVDTTALTDGTKAGGTGGDTSGHTSRGDVLIDGGPVVLRRSRRA